MRHELKSWPAYFERVWTGEKPFELRRNDRGYQAGDVLVLREWQPHPLFAVLMGGEYTGRQIEVTVTYVLTGTVAGFDLADRAILGLDVAAQRRFEPEFNEEPS